MPRPISADHFRVRPVATRTVAADILTNTICGLDLEYPEVNDEQRRGLAEAKPQLLSKT